MPHMNTVYLFTLDLHADHRRTDVSGAFAQLRDQLRGDQPDMAAYGLGDGDGWRWDRADLRPSHSLTVSDIRAVEFTQSSDVTCGLSLALLGTTAQLAEAATRLAADCGDWACWLPSCDAVIQLQRRGTDADEQDDTDSDDTDSPSTANNHQLHLNNYGEDHVVLTWQSDRVDADDILDVLGRALRRLELSGLTVSDASDLLRGRRRGSLHAELNSLGVYGLQILDGPPRVTHIQDWTADRRIC